MADSFSLTIDDAAIRRALRDLARKTDDLTPAMQDVGRALADIAEDAFQSETDPFGQPWEPLSQAHVDRPRSQGGRGGDPNPILQLTGRLAASLSHEGTRDSATVSLGTIYAARVTLGDEDAGIPRRLVLPVDPDTEQLAPGAADEILDILRGYLDPA